MLRDISVGKRLFGLSFFDAEASPLGMPPVGHVGCVAEITEVQPLADGRSNILTVGLIRYRVESYVEHGDPYLVGEVKFFEDEPEDEKVLRERAQNVAETFMRIARAVRTISDERTPLPDLPADEPERLSFLMAGAIDLENDIKLELLKLRSTSTRLDRLRDFLSRAVDNYEERARMHSIAKTNGHGGRKIELE
jgi:Lon protease-like protein